MLKKLIKTRVIVFVHMSDNSETLCIVYVCHYCLDKTLTKVSRTYINIKNCSYFVHEASIKQST